MLRVYNIVAVVLISELAAYKFYLLVLIVKSLFALLVDTKPSCFMGSW